MEYLSLYLPVFSVRPVIGNRKLGSYTYMSLCSMWCPSGQRRVKNVANVRKSVYITV
jgi:hypothetical protein